MSTQNLAQKVLARHLAKKIEVRCVRCAFTENSPLAEDGKPVHPWRTAMQEGEFLCSDLCERRWFTV